VIKTIRRPPIGGHGWHVGLFQSFELLRFTVHCHCAPDRTVCRSPWPGWHRGSHSRAALSGPNQRPESPDPPSGLDLALVGAAHGPPGVEAFEFLVSANTQHRTGVFIDSLDLMPTTRSLVLSSKDVPRKPRCCPARVIGARTRLTGSSISPLRLTGLPDTEAADIVHPSGAVVVAAGRLEEAGP